MDLLRSFSSKNTVEVNSSSSVVRIVTPEDFLVAPFPPDVTFTGYQEPIYYSLHSSSLATDQCIDCVKFKLHVKDNHHCSSQCFISEWEKHKEHHGYAEEIIRETSTGNYQVPTPPESDDSLLALGNGSSHGESAMMVENKAFVESVANPPNPRRRMIESGSLQKQSSNGVTFTVLSYNILSSLYAGCNDHCPSWALAWEYRRENLLQELIGYRADIICLQEVQSDHFQSFFKPQFAKYGYSVLYKEKTNGVYTCNGDTAEGCATFYRHNLFKEITKYEVEFGRTVMPVAELLKPEQRKQGQIHLVKGNVALVVILETLEKENSHRPFQSRICVANTHVVAGKDYSDVRLCQVAQLVQGLEKIAESRIPILICGDFNSLPKSHSYKLIVKGKVKGNSKSAKKTDPFGIYQYLKLRHSLPLVSAYPAFFRSDLERKTTWRNIHPKTMEPLFTYHKPQFSGTIDYIFHTEDSLKVESVLEVLDEESIGADFLPSPAWSSDHIALMARFRHEPSYSYHCTPIPPNPWLNTPPPGSTYEAQDKRFQLPLKSV